MPFLCQFPVGIGYAVPGVFRLPVTQDENIHKRTDALGTIRVVLENDP
jgi:hypothetical protein